MRASAAKRLKKSSSGPNTIDGRMIDGRRLRRQHRRSPAAFERA